MVVGAFPLAKLAYLGIRQISKPIAAQFKQGAKRSHVFRKYVCIPTAQLYHLTETTAKMLLLGLGKPVHVAPLNEQMAVELGADILGEALVFSIAAATITFEVMRTSAKAKEKEDQLYDRLDELERRLETVGMQCEQQNTKMRQLQHQLAARKGPLDIIKQKLVGLPDVQNAENLENGSKLQSSSSEHQAPSASGHYNEKQSSEVSPASSSTNTNYSGIVFNIQRQGSKLCIERVWTESDQNSMTTYGFGLVELLFSAVASVFPFGRTERGIISDTATETSVNNSSEPEAVPAKGKEGIILESAQDAANILLPTH